MKSHIPNQVVFILGEGEKGEFHTPLPCFSVQQLFTTVGNPPLGSEGISFAIQFLIYQYHLFYFRVQEEGFSSDSYQEIFQNLETKIPLPSPLAICMPGVGDAGILDTATTFCKKNKSLLLVSEKDLFDYLISLDRGAK